MGSPLGEMDAVKEGIPLIDVAHLPEGPQVLLDHPDQGIETFADLAKLDSIFMGKDGYVTYYEWMKKNFEGGFRREVQALHLQSRPPSSLTEVCTAGLPELGTL